MRTRRWRATVRRLVLAFAAIRGAEAQPASDALVEARRFYARYELLMRTGDREGLVGLYHPDGAYLVGFGRADLMTREAIETEYQREWQRPSAFEWQGLTFEQIGPEVVLVAGRFSWRLRDAPVMQWTYSAVLRRRDGQWYIRLEDEAPSPEAVRALLCGSPSKSPGSSTP